MRGFLGAVRNGLLLRCPACRREPIFTGLFRMHPACPRCGCPLEREAGYFIGAIYINYAATVAIAVPGFLLLDAFTGMTINQQLALWVPFAIIFPLLFFHHSRSLWLVLDHLFNPAISLYNVPSQKSSNN